MSFKMTDTDTLNILIVYDTHEFGSAISNAIARQGVVFPEWMIETHTVFTWLAGGMCYKKNEALNVAKTLKDQGHNVTAIDIKDLALNRERKVLFHKGEPFNLKSFDGAWLRLAGRINMSKCAPYLPEQSYFDIADYIEDNIPAVTPFRRMLQLDGKIETQKFLEAHNIPVPQSLILMAEEKGNPDLDYKLNQFLGNFPDDAPLVLKKDRGSGGDVIRMTDTPNIRDSLKSEFRGLFITSSRDLIKAKARAWLNPESTHAGVVIQEFIEKGERDERRIEVLVTPTGPEILHAYQRNSGGHITLAVDQEHLETGDFSRSDGRVCIMDERDKKLALRVAGLCGYGRWGIDLRGDEPRVLEANPFSTIGSRITRSGKFRRKDAFDCIAQTVANVIRHKVKNNHGESPCIISTGASFKPSC
jgi:glutathione synthase/RimK-type ligase-like ATP-grasp enzyme